jgi:small-conductance mechanosensitive channel
MGEDLLVGLVALAVVPWTLWTIRRGLRDDRLPIGRIYVLRAHRPAVFGLLLAFYGVAAAMMALISLDLLAGVRIWA